MEVAPDFCTVFSKCKLHLHSPLPRMAKDVSKKPVLGKKLDWTGKE